MNCPACGRKLAEITVDDVTVDICRHGYGGIWFDGYELQQVDEAHEGELAAIRSLFTTEAERRDAAG